MLENFKKLKIIIMMERTFGLVISYNNSHIGLENSSTVCSLHIILLVSNGIS